MIAGQRVRLTRDVERYPDFIARKGQTGEYVGHRMGISGVLMDGFIDGAQDWDNIVYWNADNAEFVENDVEMIATLDARRIQITLQGEGGAA